MAGIGILDRDDVAITRPTDAGSRYVAELVRAGAPAFVANARVRMEAAGGDRLLPVVINDGTSDTTAVCSLSAHYVHYAVDERTRHHSHLTRALHTALTSPVVALLRAAAIDRTVFVNNWLLATSPRHGLSAAEIAALTARLTDRHPGSAIIFRSLNPVLAPRGLDALRASGYRMIRSRRVYLVDPRSARYRNASNAETDRRLLRGTSYSVVECPDTLLPHAPRMAELYREIYIGKYTRLNPDLTARFFRVTLAEGVLTYRALVKDGRVDAFCGYYVRDDGMTGAVLGHDRLVPQRHGLYRMTVALLLDAAAERGITINLSGGAGRFKLLRGAVPVEEYDAVYDRHLPPRRRLGLAVLAGLGAVGEARARRREPWPP